MKRSTFVAVIMICSLILFMPNPDIGCGKKEDTPPIIQPVY